MISKFLKHCPYICNLTVCCCISYIKVISKNIFCFRVRDGIRSAHIKAVGILHVRSFRNNRTLCIFKYIAVRATEPFLVIRFVISTYLCQIIDVVIKLEENFVFQIWRNIPLATFRICSLDYNGSAFNIDGFIEIDVNCYTNFIKTKGCLCFNDSIV